MIKPAFFSAILAIIVAFFPEKIWASHHAAISGFTLPTSNLTVPSQDALTCIKNLRQSRGAIKGIAGSAAYTSFLGAATLAGAYITGPTYILPVFISYYGGEATINKAEQTHHKRLEFNYRRKIGKALLISYQLLAPEPQIRPAKVPGIRALYEAFTIAFPLTLVSVQEFAETMVRASEAGWFCYQPPLITGHGLPAEKAPEFPKTLFNSLFPEGKALMATDEDILNFRNRSIRLAGLLASETEARVKAQKDRQIKNQNFF